MKNDIDILLDELFNYTVEEDGMDKEDNLTDSGWIIQNIHDDLLYRHKWND